MVERFRTSIPFAAVISFWGFQADIEGRERQKGWKEGWAKESPRVCSEHEVDCSGDEHESRFTSGPEEEC